MNKKQYIYLFSTFILLYLATLVSPIKAKAVEVSPDPSDSTQRQAIKEKLIANRCEEATKRITGKVDKYGANRTSQIEKFNRLKVLIEKHIEKLKSKGVDTTKLSTDLTSYEALVKKYADSYAVFINLLKEAQKYECGKSEGLFKESLNKARIQFVEVVVPNRKEVREFFIKIFKEDLKSAYKKFNTIKSLPATSVDESGNSNKVEQ